MNFTKELNTIYNATEANLKGISTRLNEIDEAMTMLHGEKKSLKSQISNLEKMLLHICKVYEQADNLPDKEMKEYFLMAYMLKEGMITPDALTEPAQEVKSVEEKSEPVKKVKRVCLSKADKASYYQWKEGITCLLENDGKKGGPNGNILHNAYKYINRTYGIVFDQEKKEFYQAIGRKPLHTMELCWWIETTKPVCKNLLAVGIEAARKEMAT